MTYQMVKNKVFDNIKVIQNNAQRYGFVQVGK